MRRFILVLLLAVTAPSIAEAGNACVSNGRNPGQLVGYNGIKLVPQGFPSEYSSVTQSAMAMWNDPGCNVGGSSFPQFSFSSGLRTITVQWMPGKGPRCGTFAGSTITLWASHDHPVTHEEIPCAGTESGRELEVLADTLAHEMGHVLGLNEAPPSTSCASFIMAARRIDMDGKVAPRSVQSCECQSVAEANVTPEEAANNVEPPGGGEDGDGGANYDPPSPIVIDVDRRSYRLTSAQDGVLFDVDADGELEAVAWTEPDPGDAFLTLDRNGNGTVDDGSELFGNFTWQHPSDDPNGFRALAPFDEPEWGGDGDGVITAGDRVFGQLRLWFDRNHDGVSQPDELEPPGDRGITAFELGYFLSERRDRHGNLFRWRAMVHFDHLRRQAAADVIFVTVE